MQEAENKEINYVIPDSDYDRCFALWKPKIIEAIDHIKIIGHKRVDINAIFEYINKNTASSITKNAIENFISQLTKQKIKRLRQNINLLVFLKNIIMKLFQKKSLNPHYYQMKLTLLIVLQQSQL